MSIVILAKQFPMGNEKSPQKPLKGCVFFVNYNLKKIKILTLRS